jgi:hypothetical protein
MRTLQPPREHSFDADVVKEGDASGMRMLEPVMVEEPDPTLMPDFSKIRDFMFGGVAFQALKENVENSAQRARDYNEEMADIIVRNIHPPTMTSLMSGRRTKKHCTKGTEALRELLGEFLFDLKDEAGPYTLSASDRAGIKTIQTSISQLTARVSTFWTRKVPLWQLYPTVTRADGCRQSNPLPTDKVDSKTDCELFEAFVCSSRAFLDLAGSVAGVPRTNTRKSRWRWSSQPFSLRSGEMLALGRMAIPFECVSSSYF